MRNSWIYYGSYLLIVVSVLWLWVAVADLSLIRGGYFSTLARKNRVNLFANSQSREGEIGASHSLTHNH